MKCYYDFHIHTALSPCGHQDMTPNNIVNMAIIGELDAIAITDHNSCENVKAVMEVAEAIGQGLIVIPGMEVESMEEIHIVTLFPHLEAAYQMQQIIYSHLPPIKNKAKIFGEQILYDAEDEIIGYNERFLLTATQLTIDEIFSYAKKLGGIAIPAHIDRPSYSILSNLGLIPPELDLKTVEVSRYTDYPQMEKKYSDYLVLQSSDAHDLEIIYSKNQYIEVEQMTIEYIIKKLTQGKN